MRKLVSLCLCVAVLLGLGLPVSAAPKTPKTEEPLLEVTLVVHSNLLDTLSLDGLYRDGTLYMHPATLAALMGCEVDSTADRALFRFGSLYSTTVVKGDSALPTVSYNDTVYISAPHLLRQCGATVVFGQDELAQIHMLVTMPYSILDLLGEYLTTGGYRFSWAEAEGKWVDPQDVLHLAALDTILFGYDSNVLGYVIPGRGDNVAEDIYTDILLELLRTEGDTLISNEDSRVKLFGDASDTLDVCADWITEVMDWVEEDTFSKTLHSTLGKVMDGTGNVVSASGAYLKALDTARQFANMTDTQKQLLKNTLDRIDAKDPARKQLPQLFSASKKASNMVSQQYNAEADAAWAGVNKLMNDALDSWLFDSNPFAFACDAIAGIVKINPLTAGLVEAEKKITFAAETDNIRVLAQQMIDRSCSVLDANSLYLGKRGGEDVYETLRYEIILSLKASLTSRLLLIDSGFLSDSAKAAMQSKATATAQLLNKAQNAQYVPLGWAVTVDEDLTWIARLAGSGQYGMVVESGGYTYYWKTPTGGFDATGVLGSFGQALQPTLIRRDAKGKETELLTAVAELPFAVTNTHIITTENSEVCSYDLEGKNRKTWVKGTVEGITANGKYALCQCSGSVVMLDVRAGKSATLTSSGSFERVHDGVIYYTVEQPSKEAKLGQVELRAVNADGTQDRLIIKTQPDLYSYGNTPANVVQMHFDEEGLYFSYGSVAGTGVMYQQGRVMYVTFDGATQRVVAGQDELVGADFAVNADGSVESFEDYYIHFAWHRTHYMGEDGVVWIDPVTGVQQVVADASDYRRKDVQYENVTLDYAEKVGDRVYYMLHYVTSNPEADFGWREGQSRMISVLYMKDMETGKITELNVIK